MRWAPLVLIAAGCGKAAPAPPTTPPVVPAWTSGARLRAMVLDGGEGAVKFSGWFDSKLGVSCSFMTARDGVTRCLPPSAGTGKFGDASCTKPVYAPPPCSTGPTTLFSQAVGMAATCMPAPNAAYQTVAAMTTELFSPTADGGCAPNPGPAGDGVVVGSEIDPSAFVAGTSVLLDTGDGLLAARALVAEDGAQIVTGLADEKHGFDCEECILSSCLTGLGGAENRCAPQGFMFPIVGNYFSDPTCDEVANVVEVDATTLQCVPPNGLALVGRQAHAADGGTPGEAFDIESIGAALPPGSVFERRNSTCMPAEPRQTGGVFHELGSPVPLSSFLAIARGPSGRGRLRALMLLDARGTPLLDPNDDNTFVDEQTGATCRPTPFASGLFCVPDAAKPDAPYFTDPNCTVAVADESVAGLEAVAIGTTPSPCAPSFLAYEVGPSIPTPEVVYAGAPQNCIALGGAPSGTLFSLNATDPARFWAPVTARTE